MSEKYIRQIIKKLKCSKAKREEIRKQLLSDIMAETESGETIESVIERMGKAEEIAEEFNRSFPDSEKKTYRREKWTKRLLVVIILILCLAAVIYWVLPKSTMLEDSKVFHKEEVQTKAEEIIQLLDAGDYDALQDISNEKMKSVMTEEFMEQAKRNFGAEWGDFKAFGNIYLAEVKQMGKRNAVVQVNASYENVSVTYTISFDENMELAGLWMK